ncbi:MAG: PQQ-dependent sugar dehydrogenase [Gammaproteobacteria bacterium]|nr:PQQ-dependent sugar dehydrogenase [Gammaproteobacteria bacterium]
MFKKPTSLPDLLTNIYFLTIVGLLSLLSACGGGGGGGTTPPPPEPPPAPTTPTPTTPTALSNPIETAIEVGSITLAANQFVRAPESSDTVSDPITNDAYARIQYIHPAPDDTGRLFIQDVRGIVYVTDLEARAPTLYVDLRTEEVAFYPDRFPNESGFLGFTFHPQFAEEDSPGYGKFYTGFSARADSGEADFIEDGSSVQESVIYEWTATDSSADVFEGSRREMLRVGQFASNHNIATLAFNPNAEEDSPEFGMLYVAIGDGGSAHDPGNHGQNKQTPLGALLRIDPLGGTEGETKYGIPSDNPFVDDEEAIPELWAYGLRHPQHFSWDSDGRMFLLDIGQDEIEEVNIGVAGGNFGWRIREGTFATGHGVTTSDALGSVYERPEDTIDVIYPVAQYDHDEGFAIGSGYVYRGSKIPELVGKYVFTEMVRGRIFYIDTDNLIPGEPTTIYEIALNVDGTGSSLVEVAGFSDTYLAHSPHLRRVDARLSVDNAGELYLLTKGDGWIRTLAPLTE